MVGNLILKIRRSWRAWLFMSRLLLRKRLLLSGLLKREKAIGTIISLTTIPTRIKSVEYAILSILNGTVIAENIYLYVSEETFRLVQESNSELLKLAAIGYLQIRVVADVRSYTKLIYAIDEHPNKSIVICDDDVLYPKYWLAELLVAKEKYGNCKVIVAHRAHEVCYESNGQLSPYSRWKLEVTSIADMPSKLLFPTGTGGVLYPPGSLPAIAKNISLFKKYAPTADDVWFWFSALSNGSIFALTGRKFSKSAFLEIPNSQKVNLFTINVHQKANDTQIKNTADFFLSIDARTMKA
ncbi:MAG: hypothetical protein ABIN67_16925 [Ferruginibacter sp.]